jgi:hypothetical protein
MIGWGLLTSPFPFAAIRERTTAGDARADPHARQADAVAPARTCRGNEVAMFDWIRTRGPADLTSTVRENLRSAPVSAKYGRYQLLHKYLKERYAGTVVLKMSEIEDLLGFALPADARDDRNWWTVGNPGSPTDDHSHAWTGADRTAQPNLIAGTVIFERVRQR